MRNENTAGRKNSCLKKILSVFVAITIMFGCFGGVVPVFAYDPSGTFLSTEGNTMTWTLRNQILYVDGIGSIPSYSYNGVDITSPWREQKTNITGIVIFQSKK